MPDFAVIFEREREKLLAEVDRRIAQLRTTVAAQDDGVVVANDHRILNFRGDGVLVSDDPARRRVNVDIVGAPTSLTTVAVALATTTAAKVKGIPTGSDPEALYPGWTLPGFDDSAWATAVAVTPNSGEATLVPTGATAIGTSGVPYGPAGTLIASGSLSVTSETGVTVSGLTAGVVYAVETTGGPWTNGSGPSLYGVHISVDGGTTWTTVWPAEMVDANHPRYYVTPTGTSLKIHVADAPGQFADNGGSLGYAVYDTSPIEFLVRRSGAITAGTISAAELSAAFDASGRAYVNGGLVLTDATTGAAGPQLTGSVSPGTLVPGGTNVIAAHVKGLGGSTPEKAWFAAALSVTYVGAGADTRYIPYSLFDAAGDILMGTGADTGGRVAKGADGTFWGVSGGAAGYYTPAHSGLSGLTTGDPHTQYVLGTALNELVDDRVAALLLAGNNVTLTYDDAAGTLTIASTGGGGSGAWTQLGRQVLAATSATITFSSISGSYNLLVLVLRGRGAAAAAAVNVLAQFNSDTAGNYYDQRSLSNATTGTNSERNAQTTLLVGELAGASDPANLFGVLRLEIPEYARTDAYKATMAQNHDPRNTTATNQYLSALGGLWKSTSALTRIDLTCSSGSFEIGTAATLWGVT